MEGTPLLPFSNVFLLPGSLRKKDPSKSSCCFCVFKRKEESEEEIPYVCMCVSWQAKKKTENEMEIYLCDLIDFAATKKWHRAIRLRLVLRRFLRRNRGHRRRRRGRW